LGRPKGVSISGFKPRETNLCGTIEQLAEKVDRHVPMGVMLSEARLLFGARSRSTPTNAGLARR
jgi:hypothetical protein